MTPESAQRIQALEDKVDNLENKMDTLIRSVEDLVTAWNTAKGMTAFIKWLASAATAAVVVYNLWQHGSPK